MRKTGSENEKVLQARSLGIRYRFKSCDHSCESLSHIQVSHLQKVKLADAICKVFTQIPLKRHSCVTVSDKY